MYSSHKDETDAAVPETKRGEVPLALDSNQPQETIARHLTNACVQIEELRRTNAALRRELSQLSMREAQARHDAYHDVLTCLPNRRLMLDRLQQALGRAVRQKKQVVLLLLDLDGFKAVNDKLGHAAGDQLLRVVAHRLVACIRSTDTACRYGGDEFVVMLPEINNPGDSAVVEQKIRTALAVPYVINDVEVTATVSVGSAVFPIDAKCEEDLLQQADTAMYRVKGRGAQAP